MTTTTYYNLNIVDGTDIVNPLTVDNPNYETIDEVMHDNAVSGVTLATEIANATVHAITRENSECSVIRFIATSEWKAGDTATVDGVPVTALLPSGETLPDGAYVINANVLCILTGTNLTVYAERKKTDNANEIAYNETTVGAELTALNDSLDSFMNITTTPKIVGTWDGKPVYEQIFRGSIADNASSTVLDTSIKFATHQLVSACGEVTSASGTKAQIGAYISSAVYSGVYISSTKMELYHSTGNRYYNATIRYVVL